MRSKQVGVFRNSAPYCLDAASSAIRIGGRMMTLDEAIRHCEEVVDRCAVTDGDLKCEMEHRQLAEWLKELKQRRAEQRWIPVSERMPEDEYVLISKIPSKISGSKWSVAIAIRTADLRSRKIQWRDSGFGVIQDNKVLAWMPLPGPYKERKNETDNSN